MIKFFRKIRQKLVTEKRFSKYLIYAIGEIILVVIGILIALSINNWNEDKKSKQIELALLKELHTSITEEISSVNLVIERNKDYVASAKIVLDAIENNQIITDSVSNHLQRSFRVWRYNAKTSAYYNLRDYGLHIFKNRETREALLSAYDGRASFVSTLYERYHQFVYNVVEPILADQFEFKEIGDDDYGLFPLNNKLNVNHHQLKYLLIKSMNLQDQIIRAKERTMSIFKLLDKELKNEMTNYENI